MKRAHGLQSFAFWGLFGLFWILAAVLLIAASVQAEQQPALGAIEGRVIDSKTQQPIDYANVVLVGTTMGGMSDRRGAFRIYSIPVGTYELRASFIGFHPQTLAKVVVSADQTTVVEFELARGVAGQVKTITVHANAKKIDVKSSDVSKVTTEDDILSLPVDTVEEALALNVGVIVQGGSMHVRGGREDEISVRIDGVPVEDPLGGNRVELGLLSTAQMKTIYGGMEAEYGNASSAVILYTTKSGGRRFEGDFRYMTDDYGRADKTYTNYDRLSLGFGGPTPFKDLTYYVSGEASYQDGEFLSSRNDPARKYLGGLITAKERANADYRTQFRLDWKPRSRIQMSGEMTLSKRRSTPYVHNWTTEGYVAKVMVFQAVRPNRFRPGLFTISGKVTMYSGPWFERARTAVYVDIREQGDCEHCLMPLSDNQVIRAARVIDAQGRGSEPDNPVFVAIDRLLFEGFQNPLSEWVPELEGDPGDSNKVYYNSAEHTITTHNTSTQFKWTLTHTLSAKSFYEVKFSRLGFETRSGVGDRLPEEYESAGKYIYEPGVGASRIGTVDYYTDPQVPFFATAYDYPYYLRRSTATYLLKTDLTTQRWQGHSIKTGMMLQYNDMDNAELEEPGRRRGMGETYGVHRNLFRNFNPEGSFYVQDQWQYEGMVVNAGLRFDFFSPGSGVGIGIHNREIRSDVERWKSQWSPRLGLAFPITDRDVFHFHYGRFVQFPARDRIFASQDPTTTMSVLGNPNLDPETSISYQAGVKHQFTNTISAQLTVFNKDYFGLTASTTVTDDSTGLQRRRYINKAYASSRGFELVLSRAFQSGFSFETSYTYSFADGVASDADFGRRAEGLAYIPTGELPLRWDQRHTLNSRLLFARNSEWLLQMVYQYGSGLPWTPTFRFLRKQDPLLENSRRFSSTHIISFHGEKRFRMMGWDVRFFVDGKNLLDDDVIVSIDPGIVPRLQNATADYLSYATETGRFGGAYYLDRDGDGRDEAYAVNDPRVFGQGRLFRVGLGFGF